MQARETPTDDHGEPEANTGGVAITPEHSRGRGFCAAKERSEQARAELHFKVGTSGAF